ncbi:uncharacterized protein LOC8030192, partial [Ixodes scapularis]|uniref:uncharacterized protein LOC8030192 n=1 Tax=Ixodes scapularis TaxID=6945 RepID=UPI001C392B43
SFEENEEFNARVSVFNKTFPGKGATVSDSNFFMDTVLEVHLPGLIRHNPSLYPETLIHTHSFEILSDDCLVRDLKVNLTEGAVKGLDVATSRLGTCGQPFDVWGTTTIFCYLELSGLQVTYTAKTMEDAILATSNSVSVDVSADSVGAFILASVNRRKEESVTTFTMGPISLLVNYDSNFHMSSAQHREFVQEVSQYTRLELTKILRGSYLRVLRQAVASTFFSHTSIPNNEGHCPLAPSCSRRGYPVNISVRKFIFSP